MNSPLDTEILREEKHAAKLRKWHMAITTLALLGATVASGLGWVNQRSLIREEDRFYGRMQSPRFEFELDSRVRDSLRREGYVTAQEMALLRAELKELKNTLHESSLEIKTLRSSLDRLQGRMDAENGRR